MPALFGPAGNSESFKARGHKHLHEVPDYLLSFGLDCFEYQCGRGVKISEEKARCVWGTGKGKRYPFIHPAPYYISLSSVEEEKQDNSIRYLVNSAKAAKAMGATRIIAHSGSCGKITREHALELAKDTLSRALVTLDELGLGEITVCPETMGKVNQLGNLEEVLELCSLDERLVPCIDFGHLNARTFWWNRNPTGLRSYFGCHSKQIRKRPCKKISFSFQQD